MQASVMRKMDYFRVARHPVAMAGFEQAWSWICSSLIVCAQCFSRDWFAIEKDRLYRVIGGNIRERIVLEQKQVTSLANLDGA
jgi:hypothetical protein